MLDAEDVSSSATYKPVLTALSLVNGDADNPLDGGRKPISTLNSYKFHELNRPASWSQRVEWNGQQVRLYTVRIAQLMEYVSKENKKRSNQEYLVTVSGMTSSGFMKVPPFASSVTVNGIQPPTLFDAEVLAGFNPEVTMEGEVPSVITVPGMASIDAVNAYLAERHPGYEVYYDITTSSESTIAANFFTGGLGDNRQGLDVIQMVVVRPDGNVEELTDPSAIEALRATQGYACVGMEFTLRLKKVPEVEEMLVLDLNGTTHDQAYGKKLPQLLEYLAPYMFQRAEEGVWVDGVEVLDSTGLRTVLRVANGTTLGQMAERLLREMEGRSVGSVLLRVRHGQGEAALQAWNVFREGLGQMTRPEQELIRLVTEVYGEGVLTGTEAEMVTQVLDCVQEGGDFFDEFPAGQVERVRALMEVLRTSREEKEEDVDEVSSAVLHRVRSVLDPKERANFRALRKEIPESRRKEGEKLASGSMDRDIKFRLPEGDFGDPESCRAKVAAAVERVMGVYLRIAQKAEAQNCHVMWNGHLNFIPPEDAHLGYYDGGGNLHLAITAKDGAVSKSTVEALLLELTRELTALHGTQVNGVEFIVQEGEKHYPPTELKTIHEFLHFVRTEEDLAVARMVAILSSDEILNFRAPDYKKVLNDNGLSEVWRKVECELEVRRGAIAAK